MKDRIPTQVINGAVRMEQLDAEGNHLGYIYLRRADEPSEEGTPLNTEHVLTDETAEKLGLDTAANPSPNDAFEKIATSKADKVIGGVLGNFASLDEEGNVQDSGKNMSSFVHVQLFSYTGTGNYGSSYKSGSSTLDFSPKFIYVSRKSDRDQHFCAVRGQLRAKSGHFGVEQKEVVLSWRDNEVSWYGDSSAEEQLNVKGENYVGFAIG